MSKTVLHVGCGVADREKLHITFRKPEWRELRLDIDPAVQPDVVASITDMASIETGSMDGLYSSHNLEHLYPHDVSTALAEFVRVLRPDGFALLALPDLQRVAELVVADKLEEAAYVSAAGPIAPLDILYGFRPSLAAGNLFMAHRTGFTATTLARAIIAAGFAHVRVKRNGFDLWALAFRTKPAEQEERRGEETSAS